MILAGWCWIELHELEIEERGRTRLAVFGAWRRVGESGGGPREDDNEAWAPAELAERGWQHDNALTGGGQHVRVPLLPQ